MVGEPTNEISPNPSSVEEARQDRLLLQVCISHFPTFFFFFFVSANGLLSIFMILLFDCRFFCVLDCCTYFVYLFIVTLLSRFIFLSKDEIKSCQKGLKLVVPSSNPVFMTTGFV